MKFEIENNQKQETMDFKLSYTDKEYATASQNLVLSLFPNEQVTKVTKVAHLHITAWGGVFAEPNLNTRPMTIVSVRTDNKYRKPKTRNVYVYTNNVNWEEPQPISLATDGCRPMYVHEALELEVVNNDYSNISK